MIFKYLNDSDVYGLKVNEEIVSVEEIIEPINPEEDSYYVDAKGIKVNLKNAKKKNISIFKKKNRLVSKDISQDDVVVQKKDVKQISKIKKKEIEKKAFNMWSWLWVIVPIVIICFCYKKYRQYFNILA